MSLTNSNLSPNLVRGIEWVLTLFGAGICILVVIGFASGQPRDLWPAPGIHFVIITLLATAALIAKGLDSPDANRDYNRITWVAAGALLAYVILGGFSIGPFLLPAMLSFGAAAALADARLRHPLLRGALLALTAAVTQAAVIAIFMLLF